MSKPRLFRKTKNMLRAYFAHSILDYGTLSSARAERQIRKLFPGYHVLNPEKLIWSVLIEKHGPVGAFEYVVKISDCVVILEHGDHIGRGVYCEAKAAAAQRKPVFVLRGTKLLAVSGVKIVNNNWSSYAYAKVELSTKKPRAHTRPWPNKNTILVKRSTPD